MCVWGGGVTYGLLLLGEWPGVHRYHLDFMIQWGQKSEMRVTASILKQDPNT